MKLRPISWRHACAFVAQHHRHNKPPRGQKFAIAAYDALELIGVVQAGRPVARRLDDGITAEITRCCVRPAPIVTDRWGNAHANSACSFLYAAAIRACKAMGYGAVITYTQADESGKSLRAAGFVRMREIPARGSWAADSIKRGGGRDDDGGGVPRVFWMIKFEGNL